VDSAGMDTHPGGDEHKDRVHEHVHGHVRMHSHEHPWTGVDTLVDILREQLQRAQERERAYEERERVMQDHIAQLTAMLHESQQQNQRLLDIPRPAPQDARGATQARIRPRVPRQPSDRPRGSQRPREGTRGAPCGGALWPCFRSIPKASRLPRCGPSSA
jgi:hypothetical protein